MKTLPVKDLTALAPEIDFRDGDFFSLSWADKDRLVELADLIRYRGPRHRNGSRARYFFEHVKSRLIYLEKEEEDHG